MSTIFWIIALIVVLAVLIGLAAAFYERSTNAVSLVRTGIGGRKVVIDGGVLALPWFHEVSRVNMQTIRLDIQRQGERALITRDRLRVDVAAEFYLSVPPSDEAVARAAQALGRRSFQPDELRALIEGMLVDALRSVAARHTMDELHENRAEFVDAVRTALSASITRYGLALDSVSLSALDQTPFGALDENNAFNAVGLRKLAEVVALSKRERAEIEGETQVSVRRAAMEASRRQLEIDLEERRAEIAQAQQIEALMATQLAEIARAKAEAERAAAEARIRMEQDIQAADIAREQAIREAEILRARALEIAEQERAVQVLAKSQEESRAQAEADLARAEAVRAHEAIETARAGAEAERKRDLGVVSAEAEAAAAARRAEIAAQSAHKVAGEALESARLDAEAGLTRAKADAEALTARIAAENTRSEATLAHEAELARLDAMPKIMGEMMKPVEKIKEININQVGTVEGSRGAILQALESVLDQAVQAPNLHRVLDRLTDDIRDGDLDRKRRRDRRDD
ncbi:flotillin [Rhodobacter sp. NTK016B]|uniref:flotillin family protein n=1 Tax=Rhodobacter sp. NTK016B TaxID=2759676 RepID=UPI001A8CF7D9|nr:flotillin domain-containing protein [Rhodobacter sp. NTK016B]MBN8292088.1 flotillin [Rhodobacter sp. NTK016B]